MSDLVVKSTASPPSSAKFGASFTTKTVIANRGTRTAGTHVVRYYLSLDTAKQLRDIQLHGGSTVTSLSPGTTKTVWPTLYLPSSTVTGKYYLLACADAFSAVRESVESNNCRASTYRITVGKAFDTVVHAYSDRQILPPPEFTTLMLMTRMPRPVIKGSVSYATALANAKALVVAKESDAALAAFRASTYDATAASEEAFAAAAMITGKKGAALYAFLRSINRNPKNADALMGASVILADYGKPREALALARQAKKLGFNRSTAMGLNKQAIALNNEGYALLQLGRCAEAEPILLAAYRIDPWLQEARNNLGEANICQGDSVEAAKYFRLGTRRQQIMTGRETPLETPTLVPAPMVSDIAPKMLENTLDLSQGVTLTKPDFALDAPSSWDDAASKADDYWSSQSTSWALKREEASALEDELRASPEWAAHVARQVTSYSYLQYTGFVDAVNHETVAEQRFKAQFDQLALDEAVLEAEETAFTPSMQTALEAVAADCPDGETACVQNSCRTHFTPLYTQKRELTLRGIGIDFDQRILYYRHATGAIANYQTPVLHNVGSAHEIASVYHDMHLAYSDLHGLGYGFKLVWLGCQLDQPPPTEDTKADVDPAKSNPCNDTVKRVSVSIDTPIGDLSANCENLTLEASGPGFLAGFASWEAARGGEHTIVVGSKAGIAGAGASSGVYVKSDSDGNIKDIGLRVKVSAEAGAGPVRINAWEDSMDFSFVAGVTSLGGGG